MVNGGGGNEVLRGQKSFWKIKYHVLKLISDNYDKLIVHHDLAPYIHKTNTSLYDITISAESSIYLLHKFP
jgi:hypothetical protein